MTDAQPNAASQQADSGPIVAHGGRYYRATRYIMASILVIYGLLSIRDGFYRYPHWSDLYPNEKEKTAWDIGLNKALGILLPPLALVMLIRMFRKSRGEYRLEDDVVYIPGHPPVPLGKIQMIHRELWDRKGIALVDYDLSDGRPGAPPGQRGTFRLDDFVYDRPPTDQIFEAIEAALLTTRGEGSAVAPPKPAAAPSKAAVAPAAPKSVAASAKPAGPVKPAAAIKPVVVARPISPAAKPMAPAAPAKPTVPPSKVAAPPATKMPPRPGTNQ
ncbi:MAG: hypothetical protein ABR964_05210 [Tepidisphaeraceae bacterium]|jgi:hypothetical protein